jgi:hypothetical protein
MREILSKAEFDALDYHMEHAKLYDSGLYIQQEPNRGDYFVDEQEHCEYSLEEGLLIILDTIETLEGYPEEIKHDLRKLYKERFGIII